MTAVVAEPVFRGVACRHCGKAIRLSHSLLDRLANRAPHFANQVFAVRCRYCHRENIYSLKEIADYSAEPRDK
jgi:hypothetical protein